MRDRSLPGLASHPTQHCLRQAPLQLPRIWQQPKVDSAAVFCLCCRVRWQRQPVLLPAGAWLVTADAGACRRPIPTAQQSHIQSADLAPAPCHILLFFSCFQIILNSTTAAACRRPSYSLVYGDTEIDTTDDRLTRMVEETAQMPSSEAAGAQQGNPDGPGFQHPAADSSSLSGMASQNPHVARQGPAHGGSEGGDAGGGQPFQGFEHPAPPGSIGPASWDSGATQSPPGPAGESRPGSEGYVARSELGRELQRASNSINKTERDAERHAQQQPSPPQQRAGPDAEQAELDEMAARVEAWGDSAPPGAEAGPRGVGAHRQRLNFVGAPGPHPPAEAPAGQPPQQTPGAVDSAETAGQPQSQTQAPKPHLLFRDMQPRPAEDALAGQAPKPRLSFKQGPSAASAGGAHGRKSC